MPDPTNHLAAAALQYAGMGWPVIPLRDRGKIPRIKRWQELASTNPEQIKSWWRQWPNSNVGIAIPKGHAALDFDTNGDWQAFERFCMAHGAEGQRVLQSFRQASGSGNGFHLLLRLDGNPPKTDAKTKVQPEGEQSFTIDVRGPIGESSGQIVAAPSIHPKTGKAYAWIIPPKPGLPAQKAPPWLAKLIPRAPTAQERAARIENLKKKYPNENGQLEDEDARSIANSLYRDAIRAAEAGGGRHDAIRDLAHKLRANRVPFAMTLDCAEAARIKINQSPAGSGREVPAEESLKAVESAYSKPPGEPSFAAAKRHAQGLPPRQRMNGNANAKTAAKVVEVQADPIAAMDQTEPGPPPSAREGWGAPVEIGGRKLPPFPVEELGPLMAPLAKAMAAALQVDEAMAAAALVGGLAVAGNGRLEVQINPNWSQPSILWTAFAAEPGEKKSPCQEIACEAIELAQRALIPDHCEADENEERSEKLKVQLGNARLKYHKAESEQDETAALQKIKGIKAKQRKLNPPLLYTQNTTVEGLLAMMNSAGGVGALMDEEGKAIKVWAGLYSGAVDVQDLCKMYDRRPVIVTRKGSKGERLKFPALAMTLAVQPAVIQGMADKEEFRSLGFVSRFWFALPESKAGRREVRYAKLPRLARSDIQPVSAAMRALVEMDPLKPLKTKFSAEALEVFDEWNAEDLEPRQAEEGDLHPVKDWANKQPARIARLASLLHAFDALADAQAQGAQRPKGEDFIPKEINAQTVERSIEIGAFFEAHSVAALEFMGASAASKDAQNLLDWLENEKPKAGVTRHEAFAALKKKVGGSMKRLSAAFWTLRDHNWLRPADPLAAREPDSIFEVHPSVAGAQKRRKEEASAREGAWETFARSWATSPDNLSFLRTAELLRFFEGNKSAPAPSPDSLGRKLSAMIRKGLTVAGDFRVERKGLNHPTGSGYRLVPLAPPEGELLEKFSLSSPEVLPPENEQPPRSSEGGRTWRTSPPIRGGSSTPSSPSSISQKGSKSRQGGGTRSSPSSPDEPQVQENQRGRTSGEVLPKFSQVLPNAPQVLPNAPQALPNASQGDNFFDLFAPGMAEAYAEAIKADAAGNKGRHEVWLAEKLNVYRTVRPAAPDGWEPRSKMLWAEIAGFEKAFGGRPIVEQVRAAARKLFEQRKGKAKPE